MSLSRTYAIFLRQFFLMRGSLARVLPLFAWVVVDMVLWGFMTKYLNSVSHSGVSFVPTLLGAVLLWDFLTRVMQGTSMGFFEDVWSRNFLNIFATPLKIQEYLAGLVACSIATSSLGLVAMLIIATSVFGLSYSDYGWALIPFLMVLFLFGIALGILAVCVVLRFGPASEWFIWPIPAMLSPFAGVFYPLSILPLWMRVIGRCLPPSYVFESMRAMILKQPLETGSLETTLAIAVLLSVAYVVLAGWIFAITFRHGIRSGLIARYAAEGES